VTPLDRRPGAALLVTSLSGVPMSDVISTFVFAEVLVTLCGVADWFVPAMSKTLLSPCRLWQRC